MSEDSDAPIREPGDNGIAVGSLLMIVGILVILFSLFYRTSVDTGYGMDARSIVNLGLLQNQTMLFWCGALLHLWGVLLYVGGSIVRQVWRGPRS